MLLKRYSYTASYNTTTRTPNWVGWVLTSDHTDGDYVRKGHTFVEDLDVPLPRAISNNSSKETKAIGFIYQNIAQRHKMEHYACSVDEVEKVTGLDFFYQLPDSIENVIEASSNFNEW